MVLTLLADNIDAAKWLTAAGKNHAQDQPRHAITKARRPALREVFFNGRVWLLVLILLTFNTGFYGLAFWMPSIIKSDRYLQHRCTLAC